MKGMKPRELANLGVPRGEAMKVAGEACGAAAKAGLDKAAIRQAIAALVADPEAYAADPHFAALAAAIAGPKAAQQPYVPRAEPAPWRQWGTDLEPRPSISSATPAACPWRWPGRSCPTPTRATACPSAACWPPTTRSSPTPSAWTSPAA